MALAPALPGVRDFTFLQGLAGIVESLRAISRDQGHGGYASRYAAEVAELQAKEAAGRLNKVDMVRSQRMLATCATTMAKLALQV